VAFEIIKQAKSFIISIDEDVIFEWYGVLVATLYFSMEIFYISIGSSYIENYG
jgi:hypothetical protein